MRPVIHVRPYGVMVAGLLALAGGCHSGPEVRVTSVDGSRELRQPFDRVFVEQSQDGTYRIVMSCQGDDRQNRSGAGDNLEPQEKIPVRQVMVLKVNWRPRRGFQYDHPAGANASVRWLLLGASPDPAVVDYIEFEGTALVRVRRESASSFAVEISNGYLQPVVTRGQMINSLSESTFEGHFAASDNARAVIDTINGLPTPPPPRAIAQPAIPALPPPATRP
jgi:hypothetical protein